MKKFSYVLTNQAALQGKPMNHLSRVAARFTSRISLTNGVKDALIKQPHSLIELGMHCGSRVTVMVEGRDEEAAVAAMQDFFVANM